MGTTIGNEETNLQFESNEDRHLVFISGQTVARYVGAESSPIDTGDECGWGEDLIDRNIPPNFDYRIIVTEAYKELLRFRDQGKINPSEEKAFLVGFILARRIFYRR